VCTLQSFNPHLHITIRNLSYDEECNALSVTGVHLPRTKMAGIEGGESPRMYIGHPRRETLTRPQLCRTTSESIKGHGIRIGSTGSTYENTP
jgi:hypothetical protein